MKKILILLSILSLVSFVSADLKTIETTQDFERVIAESNVPVLVQFSAYWCGPCQSLKKTLEGVSSNYSDDQILLCYVDAYVNSDLKKYLDGGYPTVRTFSKGKQTGSHFVGSKSASFVKNYIDGFVSGVQVAQRGQLKMLETTEEFNEIVANSKVPVMVQFSAYWCGPCQSLKKKLESIAPSYNDDQVLICYVDAYVNTELKRYLDGGYPTVRTFTAGKAQGPHFVGNKSETDVRRYIDNVISSDETVEVQGTRGELRILGSAEEFNELVASSQVPVMVQFSAYWCGPCQSLKKTLVDIAPSYSDSQILICYVDAYTNPSLKQYLDGGYPTVRTFTSGKAQGPHFVGNKPAAQVKSYINQIIQSNSQAQVTRQGLKVLETAEEFNALVASSKVPVMVQFSAYWCGPCQSLKKTLTKIAPNYSENQVLICYVDAYTNPSLKQYLDGGYPTVRTFTGGKAQGDHFVGSKSESFVKSYIEKIISE